MAKDVIVVPFERTVPEHLEFEVVAEGDGTFTVVDHTAGATTPTIKYTGFPTREGAEKFVLAQPECWE